MKLFEKKVLKNIFGPEEGEVETGYECANSSRIRRTIASNIFLFRFRLYHYYLTALQCMKNKIFFGFEDVFVI